MKAVFFDLDDTLYKTNIEECNEIVIAYAAQKYKIDQKLSREAFERGKALTKELLPGVASTHNRMLYMQHMLEFLGKNVVADTLELYDIFWDNFLQRISLRPGVIKTMDQLRKECIRIGICTDLTAHIQHRKLQKLGLGEYIDWLITSEEAGEEKPGETIFKLCMRKSNLVFDDILYIGDNYKKDYEGASQAGMKAIWYQEEKYPDFYDFYEKEMKKWI